MLSLLKRALTASMPLVRANSSALDDSMRRQAGNAKLRHV
jgi:hypothetical protein